MGFSVLSIYCQENKEKPILLTGLVIDKETSEVLVNAHYIISNNRGGVVDETGRFAILGMINDTIIFSYVGYKDVMVVVSDTLHRNDYLVGIFMPRDTILLDEVVILPRLRSLKSEISALSSTRNTDNINAANNLSRASYTGISRNIMWDDADAQYKYISNQIKIRSMEQGFVPSDEMVAINLAAGIPFLIAYYLIDPKSPPRPETILSQPDIERVMKALNTRRASLIQPADSIK